MMNTYLFYGIINVSMYGTLLDPGVALDNVCEDLSDSQAEELWNRFDIQVYVAKVCELAVEELKKLLPRLSASLSCSYVEGSASIVSPKYYNYSTDTLWFQLNVETDMTEKVFQSFLNDFFQADWEDEFGPDYNIFAQLRENYSLYDFLKET